MTHDPLAPLLVAMETPGTPMPQQTYPPGGYGGAPMMPQKRSSGKAIAALVVGIVGFCLAWIPVINFVAFITGIISVVLGFMAKKEIDASNGMVTGTGMAVTGIVFGILQILLVVLFLVFLGAFITEFQNELENASEFALSLF